MSSPAAYWGEDAPEPRRSGFGRSFPRSAVRRPPSAGLNDNGGP